MESKYNTMVKECLAIKRVFPHTLILLIGVPIHPLLGPLHPAVAPMHEGCQHMDHSLVSGIISLWSAWDNRVTKGTTLRQTPLACQVRWLPSLCQAVGVLWQVGTWFSKCLQRECGEQSKLTGHTSLLVHGSGKNAEDHQR